MAPDEERAPVTCGWCGVPRSELTPGTTMLHADDAGIAGHRVLTACNDQHLTALRDHYRRRPFVHEELWMGRLTRAMNSPGGTLTMRELGEAAGLEPGQVASSLAWMQTQRWPMSR